MKLDKNMETPKKPFTLPNYGVRKPLAFKMACSFLWMNKYSSSMPAKGILNHPSCKMVASSDNDDDSEKRSRTFLSNVDHKG